MRNKVNYKALVEHRSLKEDASKIFCHEQKETEKKHTLKHNIKQFVSVNTTPDH